MISAVSRETLLGRQTRRLILAAVGLLCGMISPAGLLLLTAPAASPVQTRVWLWFWLAAFVLNFLAHMTMSTRRTFFHRLSSSRGLIVTSGLMLVAAAYILQYHGVWILLLRLMALVG